MEKKTLGKAQFRAIRERCGISQKVLANHFRVNLETVKRWEKPNGLPIPEDVSAWMMSILSMHRNAVKTALDAVDSITERQGSEPDHIDLMYYRSQAHYDKFGRDSGDYSMVNARAREIGATLESEGIEARYFYPEDSEVKFQQLANTR